MKPCSGVGDMRWGILFIGAVFILILGTTGVMAENVTAVSELSAGAAAPAEDSYNSGTVNLQTGWNLVGIPRRLSEENNKASLFGAIDSAGRSIWTYNPATGGWKDLTAEDVLMPLDGYFVYSSKPDKVSLSYTNDPLQVPPVKDLETGWNLVGFSGASEASARDSLLSIRKSWTQVIGWDSATQQVEGVIINGGNDTYADSRLLSPMHAYWVYMDTPSSLASIGA